MQGLPRGVQPRQEGVASLRGCSRDLRGERFVLRGENALASDAQRRQREAAPLGVTKEAAAEHVR